MIPLLFDAVRNFTRKSPGKPNSPFGPGVSGTHPAVRYTPARAPILFNPEMIAYTSLRRIKRYGYPYLTRYYAINASTMLIFNRTLGYPRIRWDCLHTIGLLRSTDLD